MYVTIHADSAFDVRHHDIPQWINNRLPACEYLWTMVQPRKSSLKSWMLSGTKISNTVVYCVK